MSGVIIIAGIIWVIYQLGKDAVSKPAPKNTDFRQVFIDSHTKGITGKELDRRISNGYYVKKDK